MLTMSQTYKETAKGISAFTMKKQIERLEDLV
ncbi:hypothetical protein [Microcoleus sp. herbarium12]